MELSAVLFFILVELLAGILVFHYWMSHYSELKQKTPSPETVLTPRERGAVAEYLLKVVEGQAAALKKKQLAIYVRILLSMMVGIAAIILIKQLIAAGVVLRTILSILLMFPFIAFVAVAIAQEADGNRMASSERAVAGRLASGIAEESAAARSTSELTQEVARG